jgi:hypothetical protein
MDTRDHGATAEAGSNWGRQSAVSLPRKARRAHGYYRQPLMILIPVIWLHLELYWHWSAGLVKAVVTEYAYR